MRVLRWGILAVQDGCAEVGDSLVPALPPAPCSSHDAARAPPLPARRRSPRAAAGTHATQTRPASHALLLSPRDAARARRCRPRHSPCAAASSRVLVEKSGKERSTPRKVERAIEAVLCSPCRQGQDGHYPKKRASHVHQNNSNSRWTSRQWLGGDKFCEPMVDKELELLPGNHYLL
jgi:hypothetical protein